MMATDLEKLWTLVNEIEAVLHEEDRDDGLDMKMSAVVKYVRPMIPKGKR
jgi:hypothetical protein